MVNVTSSTSDSHLQRRSASRRHALPVLHRGLPPTNPLTRPFVRNKVMEPLLKCYQPPASNNLYTTVKFSW